MTKKRNAGWLIGLSAIAFCGLAFGFMLFAGDVMRPPQRETVRADGIVVLTGGQLRIKAGMELLHEDAAKRLLISGVHPRTKKKDIGRIIEPRSEKLDCCVDLGYQAKNTRGNADEATAWVRKHGFRSVIVVTASYHMTRSLIEMSSDMPDVELIPHRVVPKGFRDTEWWLNARTAKVLLSEYIKLFPAALRLVASRGMTSVKTDDAPASQAARSTGAL
ncbi:MAG: YdcF family protein [Alphaproteobacteria bacterium]|nr:YdcF family protein [Alphaproteobacteria bacterium]